MGRRKSSPLRVKRKEGLIEQISYELVAATAFKLGIIRNNIIHSLGVSGRNRNIFIFIAIMYVPVMDVLLTIGQVALLNKVLAGANDVVLTALSST